MAKGKKEPNSPSEQQIAELKDRVKGFNEELVPLLGKHKLGLGARPIILPDGRLGAEPTIFDDSKPRPSAESKAGESEPPGEKVEGEIAKP